MTRIIRKEKHLSNEYWAEVLSCVAYILNIDFQPRVWKIWFPRKHEVEENIMFHMRVFGCLEYAHVPDELRRKLENKGEQCIFFGYSDESKEYKLYNPIKKRVNNQ